MAAGGLAAVMRRIDRLFASLLGAGAALDAALWLFVRLRLPSLPQVLPIHYSSAGRVDRVGLREQLFILPAIGLAVLLANGLLAYALTRRDPQLSYLLLSISTLVELLLIGAAVQLMH